MKFMISFQCDTVEEARAVVDAVAAIGKEPLKTSRVIDDVEKVLAVSEEAPKIIEGSGKSSARPNIDPGASTITKIGGATFSTIMNDLHRGLQPGPKYTEHLKLLWKRGEVKFDGSNWYI